MLSTEPNLEEMIKFGQWESHLKFPVGYLYILWIKSPDPRKNDTLVLTSSFLRFVSVQGVEGRDHGYAKARKDGETNKDGTEDEKKEKKNQN